MNNQVNINMKPQDIVVLLQIIASKEDWVQASLAEKLCMSQSEISQSIARSKFSGLLDPTSKKVRTEALHEFLEYGVSYTFPVKPGPMVRGVPTAHSAYPLNELIQSEENFVWPAARGTVRGQAIEPLYPSVPKAIENNPMLYNYLALVDAIRIGRSRERFAAINMLKELL
jgi:hypothetical protein